MGPSFAFFRPSANFRASRSSLVFSASTDARNLASTASTCFCNRLAVLSKSTEDGGLGGATWERTAPISPSIVSLAWQHGQLTSKVPADRFDIDSFYAKSGASECLSIHNGTQLSAHWRELSWLKKRDKGRLTKDR